MTMRFLFLVFVGASILTACQNPEDAGSINNYVTNNYGGNAPPASGQLVVYSVNTSTLLFIDPVTPDRIARGVALSGIVSGDSIKDIDYRPADGVLYGIGALGYLYRINTSTGACLAVATSPLYMNGSLPGIDFIPTTDKLRIVSNADVNLRINPDSVSISNTDLALAYQSADVNDGVNPQVSTVAYSNNFAGTSSTILYGLDLGIRVLVIKNPPSDGKLVTVGPLGISSVFADTSGFDISASGTAYAALCTIGSTWKLYTIDLNTGAATLVNTIGNGGPIAGIAVVP